MDQGNLNILPWFLNGSKRFPFLFYAVLWWIWWYRNNAIFNASDPWLSEKIIALIRSSSEELHRIFVLQRMSSSSLLKLSWSPPFQAWDLGYRDVLCETDCHEAFILLKADNSATRNDVTELISRIHELLKCSWSVDTSLIQRTANALADALAKYVVLNGVVQVEWPMPSDDFQMLLQRDLEQ
ncbi:hypothetical protein PIB30_011193 [Stylosanthes scabra]|uniref:RNase H type-1 domain-containing protein n=1 Tax=Stylosanthes scabra TaxID=79078 RepID=A0ABU6S5A3_9FABA|nr:hypothetical protein [Stylosanthes scabra]